MVLGPIFLDFWIPLGKIYGEEVVSDLAILARKWSKIAAQFYFFILGSFLTITLHFTFAGRIEAYLFTGPKPKNSYFNFILFFDL